MMWRSLLLGLFLSNAIALRVESQISPDGTTNTTVNSIDNTIRIDEGDRSGDNLFHSFEQFSVPNGREAFFNNANDLANIFSRVTGGNISEIEGLIRANGDANLFLINPAGIVFSEGAALDIGGSFTASTAESIVFSDEVEFDATEGNNPPLLTINMPIGLNFGNNPGSIAVNGSNLPVNNGEAFTLLGGDVSITRGQITAPGGNVELGGLTDVGQVSFERIENGTDFNSISFTEAIARANVTLSDGANIDVRAAGRGSIKIDAGNIDLRSGSKIQAGINPGFQLLTAQAGDITLNSTGIISIDNGTIANEVQEQAIGNSGNINITGRSLFLDNGSILSTNSLGQGNTGSITINVSDTFSLDGADNSEETSISANLIGTGNGGKIAIKAPKISLLDGATIVSHTFGSGNAGSIEISASEEISLDGSGTGVGSQVFAGGDGNGGKITLDTARLSVLNGATIVANSTGSGNAGNIEISASEQILLDGADSGVGSQVFGDAVGNGGKITLDTARLFVSNGAAIIAHTHAQGNAGNIIINASKVFLDGVGSNGISSGLGSAAFESSTGKGGTIAVNTDLLSVTNDASLFVSSGDINISTQSLSLDQDASIDAINQGVGGADNTGGNINLQIAGNLTLRDNSTISARALQEANGGNITIDANFIIAQFNQNNDIVASAAKGIGGNIDITTNAIFGLQERSSTPPNNTNDIDASSEFGLNGTIEINELDVNPAEGLEELPTEVINVAGLVEQNLCQRQIGSEFIVTGKGGNASSPIQTRSGSVSEVDLVEPAPFAKNEGVREVRTDGGDREDEKEIVEAQGWMINDRGMVELVAHKTDLNGSPAQPKNAQVCSK